MKRAAVMLTVLAAAAWAQDPGGLHWQKIQTPHFNVIFPREITAEGQRAANALETFYGPMSASFSVKPKRATVILSNQVAARSGGFVSLAPFQATLFTSPIQGSFGTNDWLTMLVAHEGRHLIQFRAVKRGLPRVASWLFGDAGMGAAILSMPSWWMEGDARVAESQFTPGGQARLPAYHMLTRTQLLTGKRSSYMRAMHGSYNDVLPDRYELGQTLVDRVNRTSGTETWDKIIKRWTVRAWNPAGFSSAMKKETGRSAADTYYEAMSELKERWSASAEKIAYSEPRIANQAAKTIWTSYHSAAYEPGGTVLAVKSGLATFPIALVRLHPDGREETLFHYWPGGNTRVSAVKGQMVWDEYVPDARWRRSYSVLVVRDLATGRTRRLTHGSKLEAPSLSPDGTRIVAVESTPAGVRALAIIDARSGAAIKRFEAPGGDALYTPAWSSDGRKIAAVRQPRTGGKALSLFDAETGAVSDLIPVSHEDVSEPAFFREWVLYGSPHNGIDNIYAVHTGTLRRYQVTSARFGARSAHASEESGKLLYSDYADRGFNVAELALDPASWKPVEAVPDAGLPGVRQVHDYAAEIPGTAYRVDRYRPWAHLFKAHTWGIISPPPDLTFGLQSSDPLHQLDFSAGLKYDTNEKTTGFETGATFRGLYPILDAGFSRMGREIRYRDHTENWNERTTRFGFRIPLNLSRGYTNTWLSFGSGIESRRLAGGGLTPLNYWAYFGRYRYASARDIPPRWGQFLFVSYRHTPASGTYYGNLLTASATVFVPSPVPHHRFQLEAGHERRQRGNYYFSSQLAFPRGYDSMAGRELWKGSAEYALPLANPDFAVGQVAYIKRITGNLFYDYGRTDWQPFRSAGAEAVFDMRAFSIPLPFRVGVRYVYRFDWHHNGRVEPFLQLRW